jgi:oligosaccharide repeat unit polymerase
MQTVSFAAFTLAFLLLVESVARKRDFFSPGRLYLFFHSLTLGIAFLGLHRAMTPFEPLTSLVYFGSTATFMLGIWCAGILAPPVQIVSGSRDVSGFAGYNWRWHAVLTGLLLLIFAAGIYIAAKGAGGLPLLSEKPGLVLYKFNRVSYASAIGFNLGATAMALSLIPILVPGAPKLLKRVGLLAVAVSSLLIAMTLNRIGVIFFVFFATVFYHQCVKRISLVRMTLLFTVFFSFFLAIAYYKLSEEERKYSLKLDKTRFILELMKVPYVYVANNYWNLDYALNPENSDERHPATYGFSTLQGFMDAMVLPGGNLGSEIRSGQGYETMMREASAKSKGLNTITYQWGLYKDFGMAGTLILPFLLGIAIKILYLKMKAQATVLNLALYSYLAFFVAFSWFTAMWELVTFVLGILYLTFCCWWCQSVKFAAKDPAGAVPGSLLSGDSPRPT